MKAYVLFITIYPLDGDVKPGSPISIFCKSKPIPASCFTFTLPHLTFVTLTVIHNVLILDNLSYIHYTIHIDE